MRTFDPQLRKVRHAYNSINALWRQRRRLLKAAQSIVDGRKMRGFNSWSSGIRELHRGMSLRKLAASGFRNRGLLVAQNTWRAYITAARSLLQKRRAAVARWRSGALHNSWLVWVDVLHFHRKRGTPSETCATEWCASHTTPFMPRSVRPVKRGAPLPVWTRGGGR